ncbi:MAG: N-acetylmuramoyl-L-alanine amidase [Halanaerobiales bacterium]
MHIPVRASIVIDAGHGGRDPGAIKNYYSRLVKESDIVFDISNRLVFTAIIQLWPAILVETGLKSTYFL